METKSIIRGNKQLAEIISVHVNTISRWKKAGFLDPAIIVQMPRTTLYDISKIKDCTSFRRNRK